MLCGGVVFNINNLFLIRKENDPFYFHKWTLPLGEAKEKNLDDSIHRIILEQTGCRASIMEKIIHDYKIDGDSLTYYVMNMAEVIDDFDKTQSLDVEIVSKQATAREYFRRNMDVRCRERDMDVITKAIKIYNEHTILPKIKELQFISNDELTLAHIPAIGCNIRDIIRFALSIDGYHYQGRANTLSELRSELFFNQRADHHEGEQSDENSCNYMREIVDKIRDEVAKKNS